MPNGLIRTLFRNANAIPLQHLVDLLCPPFINCAHKRHNYLAGSPTEVWNLIFGAQKA